MRTMNDAGTMAERMKQKQGRQPHANKEPQQEQTTAVMIDEEYHIGVNKPLHYPRSRGTNEIGYVDTRHRRKKPRVGDRREAPAPALILVELPREINHPSKVPRLRTLRHAHVDKTSATHGCLLRSR